MKTTKLITCLALVFSCSLLVLPTIVTAAPPTIEWIDQLGTSGYDDSQGVSTDSLGNVYISGSTVGSLGGANPTGNSDAFVSKYDDSGTLLWTEQLGTSSQDRSKGVSADGLGNVYISGYTLGSLEGINAGNWDAFLVKINDPSYPAGDFDEDFDVDGADFLKWQRDLGDAASLADWEANYGKVVPLSATSAAVPEPTIATLTLAALCLAMCRRRM